MRVVNSDKTDKPFGFTLYIYLYDYKRKFGEEIVLMSLKAATN